MKFFIIILFVALVIAAIFETTILVVAFVSADEINCNFIWCEFKTTRENSVSTYSNCYQNDVKINCSEMPRFPSYD